MRSSCPIATRGGVRPTTMATPVIVASTRTVWGARDCCAVRDGTGPHIPHGGAVALARYCPHSRMPVPATPRSKVVRQHSRRRVWREYSGRARPSVRGRRFVNNVLYLQATCILYVNCSPSSYVSDQLINSNLLWVLVALTNVSECVTAIETKRFGRF